MGFTATRMALNTVRTSIKGKANPNMAVNFVFLVPKPIPRENFCSKSVDSLLTHLAKVERSPESPWFSISRISRTIVDHSQKLIGNGSSLLHRPLTTKIHQNSATTF